MTNDEDPDENSDPFFVLDNHNAANDDHNIHGYQDGNSETDFVNNNAENNNKETEDEYYENEVEVVYQG